MPSLHELLRYSRQMRTSPSPSEKRVRSILTEFGFDFLHQEILGVWIIDFMLPSKMVAIEVDGPEHHLPRKQTSDFHRDQFLQSVGITVVRIENHLIEEYPFEDLWRFPDLPDTLYRRAVSEGESLRGRLLDADRPRKRR